MMEENRQPRFRVRLGTLLLVIAILALLLMVVIQQVQIARQRTEIQQLRLQNDKYLLQQNQLQEIIRTQRDMLERNR
jgi:Tfp pilus assembly protein PilN